VGDSVKSKPAWRQPLAIVVISASLSAPAEAFSSAEKRLPLGLVYVPSAPFANPASLMSWALRLRS
jgi:hypothetical protein